MSLVPTWVRATDGRYYKNPILHGEDWFVCFDDDDPPELVVVQVPGEGREDARRRAEGILRKAGVPGTLSNRSSRAGRSYPPYPSRRVLESIAFFFDLTGPIPIPEIHQDVTDGRPTGECVFYEPGV